jgi:hypothetical protein
MSEPIILLIAAWAILCAGAFAVSVVQAALHFLPRRAAPWGLPLAPTLAEERAA